MTDGNVRCMVSKFVVNTEIGAREEAGKLGEAAADGI